MEFSSLLDSVFVLILFTIQTKMYWSTFGIYYCNINQLLTHSRERFSAFY